MKKVLFIDRDGTLIVEPPEDYQVDSLDKLEFMPGVFQYLARIAKELDYILVMVTNQDGLGTASFPEEQFWPAQEKMIRAFQNEGIVFEEILIDRSFLYENKTTRKPGTGMLGKYLYGDYDLQSSYVIGDRETDVELAKNLGCEAIFFNTKASSGAILNSCSWADIYHFLVSQPRTATVYRQTKETRIKVKINLDGSGIATINSGLNFFDHMLEQLAKHSGFDLDIQANGDLEIDEHHTIEDIAICLGQALKEALGSKKSIERYGFLLPMDDCLAQVAIDLGGRPWLVWNASFQREFIGDMPCEMFMHFFKSFSDNANCNLNIRVEGDNEHHKIESIFKSFAKALKMACSKTNQFSIPSTKGKL